MIAATEEAPDFQCSVILHAGDTDAKPFGFRDAMSGIRTGRWAKGVEAVRLAYAHAVENPPEPRIENGKMETPEEAMARGIKDATGRPKKNLPGILFSGTFSKRAKDKLLVHSGLICADLDKLNERTGAVFDQICADPHVLACFRSPTAYGLKVVFRVDPARDHEDSYFALEKYVSGAFGLQIDSACQDVSRICFVSHDPEAFIADNAEPLPYPPEPEPEEYHPPAIAKAGEQAGDEYDRTDEWKTVLRNHDWKEKIQDHWTRPGKDTGTSATWNKCKIPNRFWCFSSDAHPFLIKKVYRPWHIFVLLEHGGNWSAAAAALRARGFGKTRQQSNLDHLAGPEPEVTKALSEDDFEAKRVTLSSKPVEPTTRLFLAGKPVATPGNLTTLISRAKTGKTATIGGVVAAIIAAHHDRKDLDTLGFTAPHTKEAVVLIDTEQSPYDAYTCHQRAFARAGQDTDIDWMCHYALVGMSAKNLCLTLPKILERAKQKHGAVFTVILDGVADFVASVNDEAETNAFITWLRKLSVDFSCPILCVIHSNEAVKAGDDGRGHLGKQLTRKAESNLLLKKSGEVTTITSDKQRKAPITEEDGVAFRWSDEHGRHISCEPSESKSKGGRPKGATFESLETIWPKTADKALTQKQLLPYAKEEDEVSESSLMRIIKAAVQNGQLVKTPSSLGSKYHLKA